MRYLLITILFTFGCSAIDAQISINGKKALYDSKTNIMLATIPQTDFGNNKQYKIDIEEGWSELTINGTAVTEYYTFNDISANKKYAVTMKDKDQNTIATNITFTFLPIMLLSGEFGYDYQDGSISLYMPDETSKENMTGKLKWRGGSTNSEGKHKRNYKIKFSENQQFFGFRKDDKWILDAGQADVFRLRNRIATEIWNDMACKPYYANQEPEALTGVRGHIVEVFLDNEYRGIYCLTECMDRKQLKLKKFDSKTGEIRGGLWKGIGWGNTTMFTCPNYDNHSSTWDSFEVKYPDLDDLEETDYSTLYNAIYFVINSSDDEFINHISEYFDIPVVIDYYIFINALNAFDNVGKNMYWAVYDKTKDKKLTPAVWDLDATAGQEWVTKYIDDATSPKTHINNRINLTYRLSTLNVDNFNEKVIERYRQLRQNVLSIEQLTAHYVDYYNKINLSGAAQREESLWSGDSDVDDNEINFKEKINFITDWISCHMVYLDNEVFPINTGIKNIPNEQYQQTIYHINGYRFTNNSKVRKGIYIQGGKKYIHP